MLASLFHLSVNDMAKLRIKDAYGLHRVVYSLFPNVRDEADKQPGSSGILFADKGMKKGVREVLIVSNRPPEPCGYGTIRSKEIPNTLLHYDTYTFEIYMNPVVRENASGKIIPLRTHKAVAEWFEAKAPSWGFTVDPQHLQVLSSTVLQFEKKGHQVTLGQAKLSGVLQVTEQERFAHSFEQGIGRGKAFGCGLLQVIPVG